MKWRYETGKAYKGYYHIVIDDEHGDMVCECYEGEEDAQAERAKLIAMAPELLEVLEDAKEFIDRMPKGIGRGADYPLYNKIERTIKKAREM